MPAASAQDLGKSLRQLSRAMEPRRRIGPVAADHELVVRPQPCGPLEPFDISEKPWQIRETVVVEVDECPLRSDVQLRHLSLAAIELDRDDLEEIVRLLRK